MIQNLNRNKNRSKIKKTQIIFIEIFCVIILFQVLSINVFASEEFNKDAQYNVNMDVNSNANSKRRFSLDFGMQVRPEVKTNGEKENISYHQLSLGTSFEALNYLSKAELLFFQTANPKTEGNETLNYTQKRYDYILSVGLSPLQLNPGISFLPDHKLEIFINGFIGQTKNEIKTKLYNQYNTNESEDNSLIGIGLESDLIIGQFLGFGADIRYVYQANNNNENPEGNLVLGLKVSGYLPY